LQELLTKVKKGEGTAVEKLIGQFRYLIVKCCGIEKNLDKRRDLESIMIIATIEAAKQYTGPDYVTFPGYLTKWLTNVAHNYIRKESHLREREGIMLDVDITDGNNLDYISRQVSKIDMSKALALLTPEERKLVLLHLVHDHTWQEISAELQQNKATLYSRYKKALGKLRSYFGAEYKQNLSGAELQVAELQDEYS